MILRLARLLCAEIGGARRRRRRRVVSQPSFLVVVARVCRAGGATTAGRFQLVGWDTSSLLFPHFVVGGVSLRVGALPPLLESRVARTSDESL